MKQRIRLSESSLHRIIKESVMRVLNEVAVTGGSGETYSLHGDDPKSWLTLTQLRRKRGEHPRDWNDLSAYSRNLYNMKRDEDNYLSFPDDGDDGNAFEMVDDIAYKY